MTRTKRTSRAKSSSKWENLRTRSATAAKTIAWVVLLAGIVVGWMWGVPRLEARAEATPAMPQVEVVFHGLPVWLKGADLEKLRGHVLTQLQADALKNDDLLAVKQQLESTGWFDVVSQVSRTRRDLIEVTGVFVTPFALIRDGSGDHLVDAKAHLLPKTAPAGAMPQFMVLINPKQPCPSAAGSGWNGADIEAGLALVHRLMEKPWRSQIGAIDLGEFELTGALFLVSDRGCRIKWGAPPGREGAREVSTAQKLKYLQFHFDRSGHIDRGFTSFDLSGDYVPTG